MAFKRSAVRSRLSPPSVRQVLFFYPSGRDYDMKEKESNVFRSFTRTLRAYLNIDVHRTFYESIVENEEITLVCDSGYNPEIITSKGFTFRVFSGLSGSDPEYIYYAIKAGAVFKGYISDIDGNGFFDVHISQYVPDGYKNPQIQHPQKIRYTETYYNAWGRKSYYTSYKYQYEIDEINKKIKTENKIFTIGMVFVFIPFCIGFFFPPLLIFSLLVFCVLGIIGLIQAFFPTNHSGSPTNHSRSKLEQQVRIEEKRFRESDKEILRQRDEKKRQIEEQRRKEEEKRRIEEAHKEYQRELQIEYERTHPNDMAIINSFKKPDKFGNILCPKCCSMVIAKLGYCPKCKTKFQLDSSEKSDL